MAILISIAELKTLIGLPEGGEYTIPGTDTGAEVFMGCVDVPQAMLAQLVSHVEEMQQELMRLPLPPKHLGDGPKERVDYILNWMRTLQEAKAVLGVLRGFDRIPSAYIEDVDQALHDVSKAEEGR